MENDLQKQSEAFGTYQPPIIYITLFN